jgi:hypothetical protein
LSRSVLTSVQPFSVAVALLAVLGAETAILDSVDVRDTLLDKHVPLIKREAVNRALAAYGLLLFVPIEYLPRGSRTDFVRRAMACDVILDSMGGQEDVSRGIGNLRVFMKRVWEWVGGVDHPVRSQSRY